MEKALRDILVDGSHRMGIDLTAEAVSQFDILLGLLQAWGRKINLTRHLEGREVVIHHFLDSLAGARHLAADHAARVVDLGAGAGFPAFPLKFALPGLRITMIESVRKKVSFCREAIRATGSKGMEAICGRGEDLGRRDEYRGGYSWAISRALGRSAEVVRLALPLLAPGGRIMVYKGAPDRGELEDLDRASRKIGASWVLHDIDVPHLEARRSILIVTLAAG